MLRFIMDRNLLLYVLAAACAVGVVSQIILKQVYTRLMRDTKNTGEPGSVFLQQLRQRFQYCAHLNNKVGNVQALIRKSVMEYRFWKLSLHQWKRIGLECLVLSLVCSFGGTAAIIRTGGNILAGNVYLWMGALAIALTAAAYGIADTGYAGECLEVRLTDYLENSGAVRDYSLEGGSAAEENRDAGGLITSPAIVPVSGNRKSRRKARAELAEQARLQKEKRELKENLAKVKAGMQEAAAERDREAEKERGAEILRQMDAKEQERIVREVLKEFLS